MNGSHRVLHLQLISFFKGVVVVVVVVVIVKMEKSTNAGCGWKEHKATNLKDGMCF